MEAWIWLQSNGFTLLQSAGIIAGLVFTGVSVRAEAKSRRVTNLLIITQNHRQIWSELYTRPELSRVLDPEADLERQAVTREEELFVGFLVLHLSSAYRAIQQDVLIPPEQLECDVKTFFALPVPRTHWRKTRQMQDVDFLEFVDNVIGSCAE